MSDSQFCSSVEIGGHRFGVITHDGKPHILEWECDGERLPRPEDVPPGYGVIRSARAHLTAVMTSRTPADFSEP